MGVRKICQLDEHVLMAFAGLTADARVLIKQARVECQSHKLTVEDPVTLEYITRHVASLKQRYTQSNGRRPFGISCLITGFDYDKTPPALPDRPQWDLPRVESQRHRPQLQDCAGVLGEE